ncbi:MULTISPECIES: BREX-1 system phosphatase PglZ type B [unclassified Limnobacter]|uniref:BREX-1 system phosphatase PglZ type B n=1 Tax=unclassified Limnobacter TaxID=2630203 RepID=UPI0025C3C83F|nr:MULTISPECIES: BREX-1 system phosphatase PglZ type B [unclassified Limnobacter]|tara:strand:+ start:665 stop:2995 length:2331 start_codon:yes stop_codon:yes gene_type:complete
MGSKLLDAIIGAIRSSHHGNSSLSTQAAAILWTDGDSQWKSVFSQLQNVKGEFLTLGDYQPEKNSGPAIWVKTAITGMVPELEMRGTSIIYCPGVSRSDLRAIETCPRDLQPLAELQYRGTFWSQANGKDWTVNAFLTSANGGLGLNVAQDKETQELLLEVLKAGLLLDMSVADLKGRQINAAWLNSLLAPNPSRDLLVWMNNPKAAQDGWKGPKWDAFCKWSKKDFGFDPLADGELAAAEKLASRQGKWLSVFELYQDSYTSFPNILGSLKRLTPPGLDGLFPEFAAYETYPGANLKFENDLRNDLHAHGALTAGECRAAVLKSEEVHGLRRQWLWARIGHSPMAQALLHLSHLAKLTATLPVGESAEELANTYQEWGWKVDDAVIKALACVSAAPDKAAVSAVVRSMYLPWSNECAIRLQNVVSKEGGFSPLSTGVMNTDASPGTCFVFVDGLRYDVAVDLATRFEELGKVDLSAQWTSLPSVTASGKAWCSPVANKVAGTSEDMEFQPRVAGTDKSLSGYNFRKLLEDEWVQPLSKEEVGAPSGIAWTECGDLDHYGHEHGIRLARDLGLQLDTVQERIAELIAAGWKKFRIVTDHGWLLMPGGLPKAELAKHQAETKWGRCAVLKSSAQSDGLTFGWDWCKEVQIAYPPGIASFKAGEEYSHGGISFQESLVPIIELQVESSTVDFANIKSIGWRGLRCNIEVVSDAVGLRVDLRTKPAVADTSIVAAMKAVEDGKASLAVADDSYEGQAAVVVVLDPSGNIIQKQVTTVGG